MQQIKATDSSVVNVAIFEQIKQKNVIQNKINQKYVALAIIILSKCCFLFFALLISINVCC